MNTGGSPFVPCGSTSRISKALNATPFYLDAEDVHFHAGLCASEHGVSHFLGYRSPSIQCLVVALWHTATARRPTDASRLNDHLVVNPSQ